MKNKQTKFWNLFLRKEWKNKMEELLLEKLNALIPGADAEFKIKVRGSDCETEGEGNIAGMLLALSSLAEDIKKDLEKRGMNRELVKFLLESFFILEWRKQMNKLEINRKTNRKKGVMTY